MSNSKPTVTINVSRTLLRQTAQIIYDEILMHVRYQPEGEKDWQEAVEQTMRFNMVEIDEQDTTPTVPQEQAL